MKRLSLVVNFIVIVLFLTAVTGCWDRRELDTLAIVAGAGIDIVEGTDKIRLTVQIIKPGEVQTPQSGGGGGAGGRGTEPVTVLESTGETVFEAVRSFTLKSPRELYWAHNQIIVIGREAAERGVSSFLDWFLRESETRRSVRVLVADGKASDIMGAKVEGERIPAMGIMKMLKARAVSSQVSAVTLQEFLEALISKTTAPVASYIELAGEKKEPRLLGSAVFKDDRFIGRLNRFETRGLLWVLGEVESGVIVVRSPASNGKVSLEIERTNSKIVPELRDGKIHMKIEIDAEANLGEQMCPGEVPEPGRIASLEKRQAEAIRNEVEAALTRARLLNADIFGFGESVRRRYPELWKEIEPVWDECFQELAVQVIVRTKIMEVGEILSLNKE